MQTAKKKRDEIGEKYAAAANRALANLERSWRSYQLMTEKMNLNKNVVLPKTNDNVSIARRTPEAGHLETERGQRAAIIEALETELSVRSA